MSQQDDKMSRQGDKMSRQGDKISRQGDTPVRPTAPCRTLGQIGVQQPRAQLQQARRAAPSLVHKGRPWDARDVEHLAALHGVQARGCVDRRVPTARDGEEPHFRVAVNDDERLTSQTRTQGRHILAETHSRSIGGSRRNPLCPVEGASRKCTDALLLHLCFNTWHFFPHAPALLDKG